VAPWWQGRLAAFDLETSAADPEEARVVTSALVRVGGGEGLYSFTQLVNPGVDIPEEATAMHGVTNERARAEGAPAGEAIGELLDELRAVLEAGMPLVIFNARYDLTVMDREARRHGHDPISDHPGLRVVDPRVIDAEIERYRKGKRTLSATVEHYVHESKRLGDAAHGADADAIAAARLAYAMGKRGRMVRRVRDEREAAGLAALQEMWMAAKDDIDALHALQVGWADRQARDLEDYFRSVGNAKLVDRVWPVILPGQRREGHEGVLGGDVHTAAVPRERSGFVPDPPRRAPAPPADIEQAKLDLFGPQEGGADA
jgi:DNA polymerase III subunit epsilon